MNASSTPSESPVPYPFNSPVEMRFSEKYARARDLPGLLRVQLPHGEPGWLITRYDDARFILSDPRFSRTEAQRHDEPRRSEGRTGIGVVAMDPPDHTKVRAVVARAFTARQAEKIRPQVRTLVNSLIDTMEAAGPPSDLVTGLAAPMPILIVFQLLGAPEADIPRFTRWSRAITTSSVPAAEFDASAEEIRRYVRRLIKRHHAEPQDDLISMLLRDDTGKSRLSDYEVMQLCVNLLQAGNVSASTLLGNFMYTLLDHPDQLALLRSRPELLPNAVEELLRFVQLRMGTMNPRYATDDVEVGGTLVRAGSAVLVSIGAANHDPAHFDNPDVLDITRTGIQHLAFGHGFHHCVAASLGRVELQEGIRALLTRFPDLCIAGEVLWKVDSLVWGPRVLPIGW
ncbi:cytochrome P450 [Streptomyces microflavus]|uniref:cytochrome P450 n=1 Tax=Streptomyces microflavus TaxID=1919 RepID=UPI00364E328D